MLGDIDWHSSENDEISENPDFKQTFPPHCIAGSQGSERVGYLGELPIEYIEIEQMDTNALRRLVDKNQFHVIIKKESIDAFDNPNTNKLIKLANPRAMVVFGVALDFCVYYVLRGLAKHKGIKLILLKDVTKDLGTKPKKKIYEELRQWGVEITEFEDLKRKL